MFNKEKTIIKIEGMKCQHCAAKVLNALEHIEGVKKVKINLDKNTVVIPYLPLVKDIDELIKVVKSTPILEVSKGKQSAYSGEKL